jgi:hypothetical protein
MSELKARHVADVYEAYTKTGDDDAAQVYLKSESDKFIAELKAQKAQLEDDCAYWKMRHGNAANAMHETEEYAMQLYNELRHHKYKRCLAMAKLCKRKRIDAADYRIPRKKWEFYDKWYKRWLELAEKFNE